MFEQPIVGSPNVVPPSTISDITGLCSTSSTHNYENEKGALKENEEQSNLVYEYDKVWEINLRSTTEV